MDYKFDEIEEGMEFSHRYVISDDVYSALLTVFRDRSPIHVDEAYARSAGFDGRVMHGAILNGFLSHFVGMHFPGRRSLILTASIQYRHPAYLGDNIQLTARVRQKVESGRVVVLNVRFVQTDTEITLATGKVQIGLRHE